MSNHRTRKGIRTGFTIVEILIVIAITVILFALTLTAVNAARDSARSVQCRNNLRQIGAAFILHHDTHGHFPTDGWGWRWVGDPDSGYGKSQPGGWVYNILPYIGEESLRSRGRGSSLQDKEKALSDLAGVPISLLACPARRSARPHENRLDTRAIINATPSKVAKSDYAVNGGDAFVLAGPGPSSGEQQDARDYEWPNTSSVNGMSFVRSKIRYRDLYDGASATYLVGEKYVSSIKEGSYGGDDQSMYSGDDADIRRWTTITPIPDRQNEANKSAFGSAHNGVCNFVFAGGAVKPVSFLVDAKIHKEAGNRRNGRSKR